MATAVIPFTTGDDFLLRAVSSLSSIDEIQEILLIDDGGEGSVPFQLRTSRAEVLRNNGNPGALGARLYGMAKASSDLVVFLDSDDEIIAGGIRTLIDAVEDTPDLVLAYGDIQIGQTVKKMYPTCGYAYPLVLRNLSLAPFSGLVVRRNLLDLERVNIHLPSWQDDAFLLAAAASGKICHLGVATAVMHSDRPNRITSSAKRRMIGLHSLLDQYGGEIVKKFGLRHYVKWRLRLLSLLLESWGENSPSTLARKVLVSLNSGLRGWLARSFDYMYS